MRRSHSIQLALNALHTWKIGVVLIDLNSFFHTLHATKPVQGEAPGLSFSASHGIPLM
jgi:hypothetical protein